jgi:hypothetical protein
LETITSDERVGTRSLSEIDFREKTSARGDDTVCEVTIFGRGRDVYS